MLIARRAAWTFSLLWFPLLHFLRVTEEAQADATHAMGWWKLRNPKLREPRSFIMRHKQTWPTFATEGDNIFVILHSRQTCSLLERKTLCSKALPYIIILEKKWSKTKVISTFLFIRHAEMWGTLGGLPHNMAYFNRSLNVKLCSILARSYLGMIGWRESDFL